MGRERRLPVGAEVQAGGTHFRVWASRHQRVEVELESEGTPVRVELDSEPGGYFSKLVPGVEAGDLYRFRLGEESAYPDPASRFQPNGPHGPSQVVDPSAFAWTDSDWKGVSLPGQVIYELHIGTFTREGTWSAAARELPELARAGITVIEVMPIADFAGRFGWGYDGVNLFAPTRLYGTPDDFRRFVDTAHANGLGVILDVVYNHLGPDGNYLPQFGPYLSDRHKNEWGDNINFDGPDAGPVREYFATNAGYWIDEFHLDGLRLDATHAIVDDSPEHILVEVGRQAKKSARGRATMVVNENESQHAKMVRPVERGGYGLDGLWNDDFHHSAMVALTGRNEAYYSDHLGTPQEFVSVAKYGYLFQGQRYAWQENRRGTPAFDLSPWRFVTFIQNHDQVANSGRGLRCQQLTSPGRYRAMTAVLLLFPGTPMLFMGQEFASSAPFFYFADHNPELAKLVRAGRAEFMTQFRTLDRPDLAAWLPDPGDPATFEQCKLDFAERQRNSCEYRLHKDLLHLRREDPAFRPRDERSVDGAVLGPEAFVIRYFEGTPDGTKDRLLLVNFGRDLYLDRAPEPLLAPPEGHGWEVLWSSESLDYGGDGTPPPEAVDGWRVMGDAAVVLAPEMLPSIDRAAAHKAAEDRAKERKRRERTRLME
ncbi:MAG: malto-oligosyltrehalose trehalohydrolase [Planctomycetia bacterium]|nr:malto-oligosyltrehalose trehalohydrolase [Planctomycetia bacterium]